MNMRYNDVLPSLRQFYDRNAEQRDKMPKDPWKIEERQRFLDYLLQEKKRCLLEIGAGTGQDSQFFQENGLEVVSTDLSPEMVERCRQKGLTAYQMDFLHLDFPPQSFDAVYAINCLLHVPKSDLPAVLQNIRALLEPDGLFYMGVYGGEDKEGLFGDEARGGSRFYSFYSDEHIKRVVAPFFELVYFRRIDLEEGYTECFQSLILRRSGS
ncbi:MAG: class I SAM-dependent methyltransferase [Chloroflexi bacterium]|nr:class I SAM-dependent methyltransferase [Chloroflexota bacterium]